VNALLCFVAAIEANDLQHDKNVLDAIDSKWHIPDTSDCVHRVAVAVPYSYMCIV
jgi:hypothetical protein